MEKSKKDHHIPVMTGNVIRSVSVVAVSITGLRQNQDYTWKQQVEGRLKFDIDVSFSSSLNRVGVSMCIRDDE